MQWDKLHQNKPRICIKIRELVKIIGMAPEVVFLGETMVPASL
jgi:hypothetical protein